MWMLAFWRMRPTEAICISIITEVISSYIYKVNPGCRYAASTCGQTWGLKVLCVPK